jgi:DnaJ-class molecular chaperone
MTTRIKIEPLTEGELAVLRRALRLLQPGSQTRTYNTLNAKVGRAEKQHRPALRLTEVKEESTRGSCGRCGGAGSVTLLDYPFSDICPDCEGEEITRGRSVG